MKSNFKITKKNIDRFFKLQGFEDTHFGVHLDQQCAVEVASSNEMVKVN
jgi:hypothetical protein